jgi:hypothetical protein
MIEGDEKPVFVYLKMRLPRLPFRKPRNDNPFVVIARSDSDFFIFVIASLNATGVQAWQSIFK